MREEIITIRVDPALAEKLRLVNNRSDFIRKAILHALDHECPLCHGTGILEADAMSHWQKFMEHHQMNECDSCHGVYISCDAMPGSPEGIHRSP